MTDKVNRAPLTPPNPILDGPFQPGISDPQWPLNAPEGVDETAYEIDRAGRINPQRCVAILAMNVAAADRGELKEVLRKVSDFARSEMAKGPSQNNLPAGEKVPATQRVTVTIGLGSSLFLARHGDDRFGLLGSKPRWLKVMPQSPGDTFHPLDDAADIVVIISSDHPYVNAAIARSFIHGYVDERLAVRRMEQGFSRPDKREFLRFDDGVDNLSNARNCELDRFVYVHDGDAEPQACINGSYLAWRKIKEALPKWEKLATSAKEGMIGRKQDTGLPLSRKTGGPGGMTPVYPDPTDAADGPLNAHIRKVQPRRPGPDFTGTPDLERRFLRRAYPYFEGLTTGGELSCGLLFCAFMRNLRKQFEWPVQLWQLNPDFPKTGTGIDMLYASGILSNVAGGYYFCPAAPRSENGFVGEGFFGV